MCQRKRKRIRKAMKKKNAKETCVSLTLSEGKLRDDDKARMINEWKRKIGRRNFSQGKRIRKAMTKKMKKQKAMTTRGDKVLTQRK